MMTTELLPDGMALVTDFPDKNLIPESRYLWTPAEGWKVWISSESVEAGGYWRTFTVESTLAVLNIQLQNAIAALAARAGKSE